MDFQSFHIFFGFYGFYGPLTIQFLNLNLNFFDILFCNPINVDQIIIRNKGIINKTLNFDRNKRGTLKLSNFRIK